MAKSKCGRPDCGCERKTRAFGAATWLAVLAAVAIVCVATVLSVKDRQQAARARSIQETGAWYPEPSFLLQHATELQLNVRQLRHVQIAEREWELTKANFDAQLKTYSSDSDTAIVDLQRQKSIGGEYGKLLQRFNKSRADAWEDATSELHPDQVITLDRLRTKTEQPGQASALAERDYVAFQMTDQPVYDAMFAGQALGRTKGKGSPEPEVRVHENPRQVPRPKSGSLEPIPVWHGPPPAMLLPLVVRAKVKLVSPNHWKIDAEG